MHIGFVVGNYLPHSGGVQKHVASLARELQRHGLGVTVFNIEPAGERLEAGVRVVGLGRHAAVADIAALPSPRNALALPRMLLESGVDVVSVHTRFFPATWLGLAAARRARLPVVLTEHGSGHVQTSNRLTRTVTYVLDKSAGAWVWRKADAVLAVSQRSAEFVLSETGRRAEICGNGIDLGFWTTPTPVPDERRLVFVGRLVAEKGWRTFLDVGGASPEGVQLQILGDGPDMKALRFEVSQRGWEDRVEVLGHCSQERVRDALRGAVLVNPSLAAEGLQTTLLEGAAAGARLVTYDVGGAEEASSAGAAAWIVRQGDARGLAKGIETALTSRWVPAAGLARYSWPEVAGHYIRVFERVKG